MIETPGVYDISNVVYHGDCCIEPCLSNGVIKDLLFKSCAHARHNHPRLNPDRMPDEGNPKFDIGSSAHPMLLQGNDIVEAIEAKDWKTNIAKEARDNARKNGRVPLLPPQYATVQKMVAVAKAYLAESELHIVDIQAEGISELSYIWKEGSIWIKTRLDWISNDKALILDYKTTGSANPNEFARKIVQMGYDTQEALYKRGVKAIDGIIPKFVFLVQEVEEPYLCSLIALSPEFQDMGRKKVSAGIALWSQCIQTGKWPGFSDKVYHLDMPPWAAMWMNSATFLGSDEDI